MSVHFISGKPGGGKTLYAVRMIVQELIHGTREIVTNVSLKLDELNAFIQEKYPNTFKRRFIDTGKTISDVVHLIGEDDLSKFFTFRTAGFQVLESLTNDQWKSGKRPDYSVVSDSGIFYVLDEIHIAFNSRAWAETGSEVIYYLSQHRKLGDDVICITQSVNNVDKQFRSMAQDYTYIRNLAKNKAGLFRLPSIFMRQTYAQPANDTSKALETGTFTLDVTGYCKLYDTAKGVGIHGRSGADTKERKKGLHWAYFVIGLPLIIWIIVHYVPSFVARHFSPPAPPVRHAVTNSPPLSVQSVVPPRVENEPSVRSASVSFGDSPSLTALVRVTGRSPEETNDVFCTGYSIFRDQAAVYFSDGTTAYSDSGEIQKIEKHWVTVWNKRYRIAVGRPSSPASSDEHLTARSYSENQSPAVDYVSQDQVSEPAPVNQVDILPTIHSQASDIPQTPRINGIQNMQAFRSQSQGQSYGQ